MIGQTVSHYKILEKLGGGGMGVVYKAQDLKLDRPVALKFLPPDLTRDSEARERFIHEAKAASALQHPNICTIHDIDETPDGQIFIVMDCYEGETLKKKIERGPLKVEEAVDVTTQVAQGLMKAHEKGIVHRDIKPANIIITTEGVTKILDFGLAKLAGQSVLTRKGSTVGTVAYMSPEQARGEQVDQRTDIWSLGIIFYEMLSGQRPFRGDYDQVILYSILNEPIQLLDDIEESEYINGIIQRCLAKEPNERVASCNDLIHLLQRNHPKYSNISFALAYAWRKWISSPKTRRVVAGSLLLVCSVMGVLFFSSNADDAPTKPRISISVIGRIFDGKGMPVEGALVTMNAVHFQAQSRSDGRFIGTLHEQRIGEITILTISHPSLRTRKIDIKMDSSQVDLGDIVLEN